MSLLEIERLEAFYGDFQALFGLDLRVEEGEVVAVIGANGAGKSTLLAAITGTLASKRGAIRFAGEDIAGERADRIAKRGIALVPEGRRLFPSLSVEENLLIGVAAGRSGLWTLERVYALFPMLAKLRRQSPTRVSGGQQQMVAIGRALLANPRLLLCDELSLGLAPVVINDIYARFGEIRESGVSIVLVEQDVVRASGVSDRLYCLLEGRISLAGASGGFGVEEISRAYFGT
ncbi:MAG TPA: ABC transporter ATP-binding protein [Hyphomicrobiales bacterium]|nr:ABC transporter ATP-binding protein [Hyphomicrobiales bacterium]